MRLGSERSPDEGVRIGTVRRPRAEMSKPEAARTIDLLAALSHHGNFSVGCYCQDEEHCHRSILRALLAEKSAKLA